MGSLVFIAFTIWITRNFTIWAGDLQIFTLRKVRLLLMPKDSLSALHWAMMLPILASLLMLQSIFVRKA